MPDPVPLPATSNAAGTAPDPSGAGHPASPTARRIYLVSILSQVAIIVTGGLVRLTGSGLGCPTWPECVPGSYTPVAHQAEGFHKYIEFGNRMLTFVLTVVVVACIVAALRQRPRRRSLVWLAFGQLGGVVGQAVLGGITVLTHLSPVTVAAHFLLSIVLIVLAVALHERSTEGDGPVRPLVRSEVRWLAAALAVLLAIVLTVGTVVTGSGPHSGDANAPARFDFDPRMVAWLHADLVLLLVGLMVGMIIALRLTDGPARARRLALALLAIAIAQGTLGYVQFFTGLPIVAVTLHMLGASSLTVASVRLWYALRARHPAAAS